MYRITDADVAGPFERMPADMMERATMKHMGYESPDEALAENFHAALRSPRAQSRQEIAAGEEFKVPDVIDSEGARQGRVDHPPQVAARACRSSTREGRTVAQFPVSVGQPRDPLPVGKLKITNEVNNPVVHYDPALL